MPKRVEFCFTRRKGTHQPYVPTCADLYLSATWNLSAERFYGALLDVVALLPADIFLNRVRQQTESTPADDRTPVFAKSLADLGGREQYLSHSPYLRFWNRNT